MELFESTCPECQSSKIRQKSTLKSFLAAFAIFLILAAAMYISVAARQDHLRIIFAIALIFSIGSIFTAGMSVAFGKNKCRECGHSWR